MSVRDRVAKQEKIDLNIDFGKYWRTLVQSLPEVVKSPTELIGIALSSVNLLLELTLFVVLTAQTAHVLSGNEKRYINLRHLLIKWVLLVGAVQISVYARQYTSHEQLFRLLCNSILLLFVTPSKFIKNLHLKYFSFSERKKYDDSEQDPANYEMSLTTRMLVSLTLFCLNASRFMITFVPLAHRKRIEEAMKGVNMVIVEEKYFWKIYESAWNNAAPAPPQIQEPTTAPLTPKASNLKNSGLVKGESQKQLNKTSISLNKALNNILRSKVGQYISINLNTASSAMKKFTFYRNVELVYNIDTSELTIISEEDNKSTEHVLAEVGVIEEENMIQLFCQSEEQPIFVRFKMNKEKDAFLQSINVED